MSDIRIVGRVAYTRFEKTIMPFTALAAATAMTRDSPGRIPTPRGRVVHPRLFGDGIHAGEREPERYAERDATANDVGLGGRCIRRVDRNRTAEAERQRSRHRAAKCRRGIWKRIV